MGKLRARVARVADARGTWITCSLLLASSLLGGCNHAATTSGATAQSTATATQTTSVSAQSTSPATQTSPPGPAAKTTSSVEVSWSAPTLNTDGSALTNLAGYHIYYGTSPGTLNESADVPRAGASDYVVQGLQAGTWYFAVVSYTNTGFESAHSKVVSKTIS